jgi:predicted transposase/invertase (TIGR01784 family)
MKRQSIVRSIPRPREESLLETGQQIKHFPSIGLRSYKGKTMPLGIDPKVDYAFKKLFGSEENKSLLIDFLQAILYEPIEDLEILNPFNAKETEDDKLSILDIKAKLQDQRFVNIEMQMVVLEIYANRALYYWARTYSQELKEAEDYTKLHSTISVHILDDCLFRDVPEYHLHFALREAKNPELVLTNHCQFHIIELPKFTLRIDQLENELHRWCYFLKHGPELEPKGLPHTLKNPPIEKAVEVLEIMTQNDLERLRYEARLRAQRDESTLKTVSFQEGITEGERIGLLEGIEGLLEVRFVEAGLKLMPQVLQISDLSALRQLHQSLRKTISLEEVQSLLQLLEGKTSN